MRREWEDRDLGERADLDARPAPLFPLEHLGRVYRVELVAGSAHGSPESGVSFWRVRRGRTEVLVTPWHAEEPAIALRARLAELLAPTPR